MAKKSGNFRYICTVKAKQSQMKTVILTIILVLVAVVLLGVKVLFVNGGRFPSGHVHDVAALRDKGIGCASGHDGTAQAPGRKTLQ